MDTDYGLPIPMYLPFVTLDPQFDVPLPFRRLLKQVTKLNADNSAPYQPAKSQRLSGPERLPHKIREHMYGYLGFSLNFEALDRLSMSNL
jgi:hypothetical protein